MSNKNICIVNHYHPNIQGKGIRVHTGEKIDLEFATENERHPGHNTLYI